MRNALRHLYCLKRSLTVSGLSTTQKEDIKLKYIILRCLEEVCIGMEQHICENAQNTFLFIFSIFFFLSVYGLLVDPANRQLYCANRENSPARKHCILCSAISGIETTAKYLAFSLFCLILLLFPAARSSKSETRRHYRVVGRT